MALLYWLEAYSNARWQSLHILMLTLMLIGEAESTSSPLRALITAVSARRLLSISILGDGGRAMAFFASVAFFAMLAKKRR